jgi:uncharacterized membrane protein
VHRATPEPEDIAMIPGPSREPRSHRDDVDDAMRRASQWEALSREDRAAVTEALRHARVARNADSEFLATRTVGERLADRIASFGGSWTFILLFFGVLIAWTGLNTVVLARRAGAFDPYPYVFLNLMLSMLAALQAPVIMMSQRRQTVRDRVEAQTDYEVNLKAELEIRALHEKLDTLREAQWAELVRMQQEQIRLLERLLGTPPRARGDARLTGGVR